MLNCPSTVNDNVINRLPQIECNVLLDKFPTVTETGKRFKNCLLAKTGARIPAEVYKTGGVQIAAERLTDCFNAGG